MKLKVQFEMQLPEGFEPFLKIIADAYGYTEHEGPIESFVCEKICVSQVSNLFSSIITNALTPYFGIASKEQVKMVQSVYLQTHSVTAEIIE
jgi:hypothetical protein